jgi:hypothetical protein
VVQRGYGERARFRRDRWLDGAQAEDIDPNLTAKVAARVAKVHIGKESLSGTWLRDCGPDLGCGGICGLLPPLAGACRGSVIPGARGCSSVELVRRWSLLVKVGL